MIDEKDLEKWRQGVFSEDSFEGLSEVVYRNRLRAAVEHIDEQTRQFKNMAAQKEAWLANATLYDKIRIKLEDQIKQARICLVEICAHFPPHLEGRNSLKDSQWLVKRIRDVEKWAEQVLDIFAKKVY